MDGVALLDAPAAMVAHKKIQKPAPGGDVHIYTIERGTQHQHHAGFGQGFVTQKLDAAGANRMQ